ncbi:DUF4250 domain-containing protein [Psychromonas aquimarina]|uniref:DUF4250 domain-containing protein n=1 Tax=Psychromonas aquimarina TaxID=444919 RepID=UPI00041E5A98|nr:DUF4250 domain-containing protein [Psychromonas aquimarina]
MYLENYEKMDPVMLLSIINMKLRDEFNGSLDELVKSLTINRLRLEEKLAAAGFEFISETGQFR